LYIFIFILLLAVVNGNTDKCLHKLKNDKKKYIIDQDGACEDISAVMYMLLHP